MCARGILTLYLFIASHSLALANVSPSYEFVHYGENDTPIFYSGASNTKANRQTMCI